MIGVIGSTEIAGVKVDRYQYLPAVWLIQANGGTPALRLEAVMTSLEVLIDLYLPLSPQRHTAEVFDAGLHAMVVAVARGQPAYALLDYLRDSELVPVSWLASVTGEKSA